MKKRILSLILALSMVLSVLPLGAFAAPLPELVMGANGLPTCPDGTSGDGWEYSHGTLHLNSGTYDFSNTHPKNMTGSPTNQAVLCAIVISSGVEITGGTFQNTCSVTNNGTIKNGTFKGSVQNNNLISGGTFKNTCSVTNGGTISDGTFACSVENKGEINGDGTFEGTVENHGIISDGTFKGGVINYKTISGGTFQSTSNVTNANDGTISDGTFAGRVINNSLISGGAFQNGCSVTNYGTIKGNGTFNGEVSNNAATATIENGTFNGKVSNNQGGKITNGTFEQEVINNDGEITGGTFAAGLSRNDGSVTGGVFNGYIDVDVPGVGVYPIAVDGASPDAKIEKVNDVSAVWDPYVVVMKGNALPEVTITANTEIYSLNGKRIGTDYNSNYPNKNDKTTVTFTMPNEDVVLSTGELVIGSDGYPVGSNGGTADCTGKGWQYSNYNGTLYLNGGTFDLSTTEPVKCKIQSRARITGGTFNEAVTIIAATITKGIFSGTVYNSDGTISGGAFQSTGSVTNWGDITGGTFAGSVENKCDIYGGVFNRNATLTDVTGGHNITWDAASSKAKIEKVNGVSANWAPYAYKDTTVTITASTDIFSLNGKPIGTDYSSSYGSDKTTVTFTMPNENVVLSGAITCTNLVMKGGYPEASNGGTTPCKGNGWTYSKKDASNPKGKLTLTDGTYDFSYTYPQNSNGAGAEPVACAVETQLRVEITGGTFEGEVINNDLGVISGGTFHEKVSNSNGMITGGTFKSSVTSKGHGRIFGGVFNSKTTQKPATDAYSITLDAAYPNAKITEVNGMSADWDPYVVVTENATTNDVIITADTEIFSLNGKSIGDGNCKSSYDGSDYKTVKFTMPGDNVVLNRTAELEVVGGEIKSGETAKGSGRVRIGGKVEVTTKDKTQDFVGWTIAPEGIELRDDDGREVDLTSEWTFSFMMPDVSGGKLTLTANYQPFRTSLLMNADGTVNLEHVYSETYDGNETRKGDGWNVFNRGTLILEKGTYDFRYTAPTEKTGTLEAVTCGVQNKGGTIENGVFRNLVLNEVGGTITGGTFAAGLFEMPGTTSGNVTGGVFNGKTGLTNAHHVTVTDGSVLKVNGEDPLKVDETTGAVTTDTAWDLYAYAGTTVTITADTDIFSLNGQPISTGNCNSSYGSDKTTVTFTMPDDKDVVLNEEINYGDLVMENGWPKDSNGGTIPCKGDGWEYIPNDPTNGDMLLLTGSNQTGGLFDFSTIGDGSAVECNVFVGKPTAITGGKFNGKVFNNSGILGGTFHGEVDNMGPGRIENGTFHGAVENNGIIENGTFNDEVKNNGTINGGVFNGAVTGSGTVSGNITGSGTLNGEPITKPEPTPEPEPTTYTVTVIGGTIDGKTSVSAKENDTLTVVLDQNDIPDGMTFDLWSISSSKLSGDINVDYRAEAMTFQMPAEDVTIRAQYRSAEIIEDAAPSPLATAATIAVGGAAAGIVVWQGVSLGVDLYLANALPQGVPVPTDRRALALLLWETAGKPEVALPTLYGDIPAEEIELQKATRWAVQNGLMDAADKKDASFFDPDHYVTKMDVFGAWLRLKKLLGTT